MTACFIASDKAEAQLAEQWCCWRQRPPLWTCELCHVYNSQETPDLMWNLGLEEAVPTYSYWLKCHFRLYLILTDVCGNNFDFWSSSVVIVTSKVDLRKAEVWLVLLLAYFWCVKAVWWLLLPPILAYLNFSLGVEIICPKPLVTDVSQTRSQGNNQLPGMSKTSSRCLCSCFSGATPVLVPPASSLLWLLMYRRVFSLCFGIWEFYVLLLSFKGSWKWLDVFYMT